METVNIHSTNEFQVISTQNLPPAISELIQQQIARFKQEYSYLLKCKVDVAVPTFCQTGIYQIRIVLTLPDRELKIDREPTPDYYQEDIYVAIWSAFDLARKKMQAHSISTDCAVSTIPVPNISPQPIRGSRRSYGYARG